MSLPFLLLDFDFLFHVYLLTVNIGEPILQEGQTLVWDNLYSEVRIHIAIPEILIATGTTSPFPLRLGRKRDVQAYFLVWR